MSVVSFISIISTYRADYPREFAIYSCSSAAVLITMIGVSVAGHKGGVKASAEGLTFASAFLAVTDIVRIYQFPDFPYGADIGVRSSHMPVRLTKLGIELLNLQRVRPRWFLHVHRRNEGAEGSSPVSFVGVTLTQPQDFAKALYMLQIADTTLYLIVGVVVYAYAGAGTVSPALGNTGTLLRKVSYGIALPTILIAGVINGHVCAKLIFIRM